MNRGDQDWPRHLPQQPDLTVSTVVELLGALCAAGPAR